MTKVVFKSYNQNDYLLFPPSLGDFIAENDPVRVLNAVVDHMDIRAIQDSYKASRRQSTSRKACPPSDTLEGGARREAVGGMERSGRFAGQSARELNTTKKRG